MDTSHLRTKPSGVSKGYVAVDGVPTPKQQAWCAAYSARIMDETSLEKSPQQIADLAAADAGYSNPHSAGHYNLHSAPLQRWTRSQIEEARQELVKAREDGREIDTVTHPLGDYIQMLLLRDAKVSRLLKASVVVEDKNGKPHNKIVTEIVEDKDNFVSLQAAKLSMVMKGEHHSAQPKASPAAVQINVAGGANGGSGANVQINYYSQWLNQLPPGISEEEAVARWTQFEQQQRSGGAAPALPAPIDAEFTAEETAE